MKLEFFKSWSDETPHLNLKHPSDKLNQMRIPLLEGMKIVKKPVFVKVGVRNPEDRTQALLTGLNRGKFTKS